MPIGILSDVERSRKTPWKKQRSRKKQQKQNLLQKDVEKSVPSYRYLWLNKAGCHDNQVFTERNTQSIYICTWKFYLGDKLKPKRTVVRLDIVR